MIELVNYIKKCIDYIMLELFDLIESNYYFDIDLSVWDSENCWNKIISVWD